MIFRCRPHFVRCIKPNEDKEAGKYSMPLVMDQLKYLGILDTVKIRKLGFPYRYKFRDFAGR